MAEEGAYERSAAISRCRNLRPRSSSKRTNCVQGAYAGRHAEEKAEDRLEARKARGTSKNDRNKREGGGRRRIGEG